MIIQDALGRKIEVTEMSGEIGEGAHITSAKFVGSGQELSENEKFVLEHLCQKELYDEFYQQMIGRGEAMSDARGDR